MKGPPDLAVEVLSRDDRLPEVQQKVEEYLTLGVSLVVVIDPEDRSIRLFRPSTAPLVLGDEQDVIDLAEVVDGFRCTVREVFE